MDEHLTSKNGDPSKDIQEMLKSTLESEEWQALTPNLPSPGHDLLPQELDQDQLELIVDALMSLPLPADSEPNITEKASLLIWVRRARLSLQDTAKVSFAFG